MSASAMLIMQHEHVHVVLLLLYHYHSAPALLLAFKVPLPRATRGDPGGGASASGASIPSDARQLDHRRKMHKSLHGIRTHLPECREHVLVDPKWRRTLQRQHCRGVALHGLSHDLLVLVHFVVFGQSFEDEVVLVELHDETQNIVVLAELLGRQEEEEVAVVRKKIKNRFFGPAALVLHVTHTQLFDYLVTTGRWHYIVRHTLGGFPRLGIMLFKYSAASGAEYRQIRLKLR
mmetsp:Transcript_25008/g.62897  ORF Transcript_25008/g.62897 Transcript_25008/m.62897 type:complete len:233 (+) Transcript_25008:536-1234(+)